MHVIDDILKDSIDMHVHCAPDSVIERRFNALQTAECARESGMRGVVLKSHEYPTISMAHIVNELVQDFHTFGSLCLDFETGGLNVSSVQASASLGAKVVWMPTFSAKNSMRKVHQLIGKDLPGKGISIVRGKKLVPEVTDILEIIKSYDMVLASGHLSPRETLVLAEEAKRIGLTRVIITHVLDRAAMDEVLGLERQKELASQGVFMEHCFWSFMPTGGRSDPSQLFEAIRTVGPDHCIMSTDFGQVHHPPAPEGMRMFIGLMLKYGFTQSEIELMVKVNPARLLGID